MDVACPRCATEYEFDEARIPSDGVTVKCTQCSHVFRIKKKASAFTTEVSQPGRDWKLRHSDGRVESFQKLTTLHSWIVERRVNRNDEVSLSGETWKRLGDIAELASFFTIVDEAERSRSLRGEVKTQPEAYSSAPAAPPPLPKQDPLKETLRGGQFAPLAPGADAVKTLPPDLSDANTSPQERPSTGTGKQPAFTPQPPPPPTDATPAPAPVPQEDGPPVPMPPPKRIPSRSMKAVSAARQVPDDELFRAAGKGGGGAGRWIGLFLLVAGIGLAGGYYLQVYQPQQEALAKQREEDAAKKKADDDKRAEEEKEKQAAALAEAATADAGAVAPVDAGAVLVAPVVDAGAVAVAAVVDAGAPAVADAGAVVAVADAGVKAPVKRDYEGWMALGDRLRASDRAEAAMNAYGEAADMKPDRAEPIAGRGLALLDMGKYLQAEASFEQALKLNSHYGPALMGMAETYRYTNKNEKAVEYYQKYLDVLPDGPESNVAKTQLDRLKKAAQPQ